jgi:hypothetical protein
LRSWSTASTLCGMSETSPGGRSMIMIRRIWRPRFYIGVLIAASLAAVAGNRRDVLH